MYESESAKEAALSTVPMGRYKSNFITKIMQSKTCFCRLGEPHDISGVVSFLASDDAGYITGETIVASGGMKSRL